MVDERARRKRRFLLSLTKRPPSFCLTTRLRQLEATYFTACSQLRDQLANLISKSDALAAVGAKKYVFSPGGRDTFQDFEASPLRLNPCRLCRLTPSEQPRRRSPRIS